MLKYKSTRELSDAAKTSSQGIIQGIAEDKGLFVPTNIPSLDKDFTKYVGKSYQEIALMVLSLFLPDYTSDELAYCVNNAYDSKFEAKEIVPIVHAGDAYFLELYHGKTAAFKDMALSILPYLLTTAMKKEKEDKKIAILTATSGDTGKAALAGFADVEGTEIIVFYPSEGVSEVQKRQMTSQEGTNTHVFAIKGNFDDAQTGVKNIFADTDVKNALAEKGYKLSSANSINIGRLVPQVAYYVYSYIKLLEEKAIKSGEKINIVVPTGNFGNILAAYYASEMGIPVNKFICASNKNKVLTDFIKTGTYDKNRAFHVTNSPSMDILISSNLERLLYHLSGNDAAEINRLMSELNDKGVYTVNQKIKSGLASFYGGYTDDERTCNAIGKMYETNGYLMDTHTAVAYEVYENYKKETGDDTVTVIASTASAYKFAKSAAEALSLPEEADDFAYVEAVNRETGVRIPKELQNLKEKPVLHTGVLEKEDLAKAVLNSLK